MGDVSERSFERITDEDLERLAAVANETFDDLFRRRPDGAGVYRDRLLLLALCQGAALHFVDGQNGVKDLDVMGFFRTHPDRPFPSRGRWPRDFGPSKFGRHPDDAGFQGRRVDILGRSIDADEGEDGVAAVRRYLTQKPTGTAGHLATKAVIGVYPPDIRGKVIWPIGQAGA
jgi:hypothetical protein